MIAAGLLTKLNFLGLLPGALVGLVLLTARARRTSKRAAYRALALALGVAASPICLYVLVNVLTGRRADGTLSRGVALTLGRGSIFEELSYIWQFYLPRLPGMHDYFPGLSTTIQFWVNGFVGLYGWVDTVFPAWVYRVALVPIALLAILFASGLVAGRTSLRRRLPELGVYGAMALGLAALSAPTTTSNSRSRAEAMRSPVICSRCSHCMGRGSRWRRAVPDGGGVRWWARRSWSC